MSQSTKSFFSEKREWSKVKDKILSSYLVPYFTKIGSTDKFIIYLDCFSGTGIYEQNISKITDTNDLPDYYGSPLIALAQYNVACQNKKKKIPVKFNFFEKNLASKLKDNIDNFDFKDYKQFSNQYDNFDIYFEANDSKACIKNTIDDLFNKHKNNKQYCVFCYIDPFGIKDLHLSLLEALASQELYSLELLINFNSHGFFRAACATKTIKIREKDLENEDPDLIEEKPLDISELSSKKGFELLDSIMGCRNWEYIIDSYKDKKIDGYKARVEIVQLYKNQLKEKLNLEYVLALPIKFKENGPCKYHMIFATNHEGGAFLMGKNMYKRKEFMAKSIKGNCRGLFDDIEEENEANLTKSNLYDIIKNNSFIGITKLFAKYYDIYGIPLCKMNTLVNELEKEGKIRIERTPSLTKTRKKSHFMEEKKKQKVKIVLL